MLKLTIEDLAAEDVVACGLAEINPSYGCVFRDWLVGHCERGQGGGKQQQQSICPVPGYLEPK
eukprot:487657-Heterocapsa_arctica.AAC.1